MKHAREDYNRIQDPAVGDPSLLTPGATAIGEDEPVFLLRAKDVTAPEAVRDWARRLQQATRGTDRWQEAQRMFLAAMEHARRMEDWQLEHGSKVPDMPAEGEIRDFPKPVYKLTTPEGDEYFARPSAIVPTLFVDRAPVTIQVVQMTDAEYQAIPATNAAATFFAAVEVAR